MKAGDASYRGIVQLPYAFSGSLLAIGPVEQSEIGVVLPVTLTQRCLDRYRGFETVKEWQFQSKSTILSRRGDSEEF